MYGSPGGRLARAVTRALALALVLALLVAFRAEPGLYSPSRLWASYLAALGLDFSVLTWCQWEQRPKGALKGPEYKCEAQLMCTERLIYDNKSRCRTSLVVQPSGGENTD